jgi:hypothetical protein
MSTTTQAPSLFDRLKGNGGNFIQATAEWSTGYDRRVGISGSLVVSHPQGDAPGTGGLSSADRKALGRYQGAAKHADDTLNNLGWYSSGGLLAAGNDEYARAASIVTIDGLNIFTYDEGSGFFLRHFDTVLKNRHYTLKRRDTPIIIDPEILKAVSDAIYDFIRSGTYEPDSARKICYNANHFENPVSAHDLFESCNGQGRSDFDQIGLAVLFSKYSRYFQVDAGKQRIYSTHIPIFDSKTTLF